MNVCRFVPPARVTATLGAIVGLVAGSAAVAGAERSGESPGSQHPEIEATHLPPLLTLEGEDVSLSYDAFCVSEETDTGAAGCELEGTAFVRAERRGPFEAIALTPVASDAGRRLVAHVPAALAGNAGEELEYYAELRLRGGASVLLPSAGASAPDRSLRLRDPVLVNLGRHVFGRVRQPAETVASTSWGAGPSDAGLEQGRNLGPIGASAFDVDRAGSVYLLDEAHHRILRWGREASSPKRIPVSVSGSLADMAVAADGSIYVLETVAGTRGHPIVRRFDADGRELERIETAEPAASRIGLGRSGPIVLQQPSHHWMPITSGGTIAGPVTQRLNGQVARSLPGDREVLVLRTGNEVRLVLTARGDRKSWRLRSETPLGEVQLAEPLGSGLVVVTRVYTDTDAEFDVIVLGAKGLVRRFSVSAPEWAEAAPLGRFRLVGSSLYRLGSTERGPRVDRFELEVRG